MLLLQKVYAEGAYALCMQAATLHDKAVAGDVAVGTKVDEGKHAST